MSHAPRRPDPISPAEAVELLDGLRGAAIVGLTTRTDARLRRRGNPLGRVAKVSAVTAMLNAHYDRAVRRRLAAAGLSPDHYERRPSWHVAVLDGGRLTPFCRHKETGELYLRALVLSRGEPSYYAADGRRLDRAEVEPWLPRPSADGRPLIDEPVEFRTYLLSSVLSVTLAGRTYCVFAPAV